MIAAVEGYAVAGGLELALWCDMRVAYESARFGVFCRRWGVPLIDGGTVRLPRLIGHSRALDMILTGREVGAREAYEWGLANRLVPEGQALAEATTLAEQLARFPQTCLRSDRRSLILNPYIDYTCLFMSAIDDTHLVTRVGIGEECDCTLEVTKKLGLEDSGGMVRVGPVPQNRWFTTRWRRSSGLAKR